MARARPWLPDCAVLTSHAAGLINKCVAGWSEDWLVQACLGVRGDWQTHVGPLPENAIAIDRGLTMQCPADERTVLASLLLGRDLRTRDLRSAPDRALVEHVVDAAVANLGARIADLLGSVGLEHDDHFADLEISGPSDGPLILVSIARSRLVAFARGQAPSPRKGRVARPLIGALAGQSVTLSAHLGCSILSLTEIENLRVGDVIILDHLAQQPVQLALNGKLTTQDVASIGLGTISHTLQIESSVQQW